MILVRRRNGEQQCNCHFQVWKVFVICLMNNCFFQCMHLLKNWSWSVIFLSPWRDYSFETLWYFCFDTLRFLHFVHDIGTNLLTKGTYVFLFLLYHLLSFIFMLFLFLGFLFVERTWSRIHQTVRAKERVDISFLYSSFS